MKGEVVPVPEKQHYSGVRVAGPPVLRDGLWLRGAGRLRVHSKWFSMIRVSGYLLYFVQKHLIASNTGTLAFMVSELSDQCAMGAKK